MGLEVRGDQLALTPRIPAHWPGFEIVLRLEGRELTIRCRRDADDRIAIDAAPGEWVDWKALPDGAVLRVKA